MFTFQTETGREDIIVTEENQFQAIAHAVTPLHAIPYPEQLKIKYKNCKNVLKLFATNLWNDKTRIRNLTRGLPCFVEKTKPSVSVQSVLDEHFLMVILLDLLSLFSFMSVSHL